MTKYIVSWRFNNKDHSASFDSLAGAELYRMALLANGYEIHQVSISVEN